MKRLLMLCVFMLWQGQAVSADLTIDITEGVEGAMPVAVVPFGGDTRVAQEISSIIAADLKRGGRFQLLSERDMRTWPHSAQEVDFAEWRGLGQEALVVGQVQGGGGGYQVRFQLLGVPRGEQLLGYDMPTTARDARFTAHRIADMIFEKLTGIPGVFATRIAYITEEGGGANKRYALRVADADGHGPQTIVSSRDPLLSPAWSPDGRRIAYVSFEQRRASVFTQDILTGQRQKVASFQGINSAPAWSPDGRSLALTLSRDGNPDIYVMDLGSGALRRLTQHFAIDTEPAWSPDGRYIAFTSDRGGGPQIYRVPSAGGREERLTFKNSYNARASYAPDGRSMTLVTREGGHYRIALLSLKTGTMDVLTGGRLDESPSFAPNGSMLIYATRSGGRGELSAVSVDGRVRQRLALPDGDVREPVWSPAIR